MLENRDISQFNEAMLQIQRLHNLWLDFTRFSETGQLDRARWKLNSVELELNFDIHKVSKIEDTNYVGELKAMNAELANGVGMERKYNLILEKGKLLKTIQQLAGKGAIYRDPEEDDFD